MQKQKRRAGRKKFQETRHPIYKGVRERKGKWVCEVRQPKKKTRVWLGTFPHPDMAAIAYDVAALAFKGDSASLNFPDAATSLPRLNSRTCSIAAIQFAAAEAAQKHFSSTEQVKKQASDGSLYWDEEEVFNMPGLINAMAEGLVITPPALKTGFNWVGMETITDLTLWPA